MTSNWKVSSIQSELEQKVESGDFKECYIRKKIKCSCTEKKSYT